MISEAQAKPGIIRIYTSGCPKIQKKCCHKRAEPPAWVSKKRAPRKRSSNSMICAADNGGSARMIIPATTSISQTNKGIRIMVMPLQRRLTTVAMALMAETMLPTPATSKLRVQ